MKNIITRVMVLAAAAVVFGLQANAQVGQQYRTQVPFDFTAAGKTWTAGTYSVGLMSSISDSGAISLLNRQSGRKRVIGISRGQAKAGEKGKLTFLRSGAHYALIAVSTPDFVMKAKQPEQVLIAKEGSEIVELALN